MSNDRRPDHPTKSPYEKKAWDTYTADIWPRHMPKLYSSDLDRNMMDSLRISKEKQYTSLQLIGKSEPKIPKINMLRQTFFRITRKLC